MNPDVLLDTCAVIWIARGDPLREPAASTLPAGSAAGARSFVSPISAWEVGVLTARNRLTLALDLLAWFERACSFRGVSLAKMPPSVLIASTRLPGAPPRDPVDRLLVAMARAFGYVLVTRDREMLDYGADGHVQVLAC